MKELVWLKLSGHQGAWCEVRSQLGRIPAREGCAHQEMAFRFYSDCSEKPLDMFSRSVTLSDLVLRFFRLLYGD